MNPLAITFCFLMLLTLLTSGDVSRHQTKTVAHLLAVKHASAQRELSSNLANALYLDAKREVINKCIREDDKTKKEEKDKTISTDQTSKQPDHQIPPSLGIYQTCPPNNSRLNFYLLLNGSDSHKLEKTDLTRHAIAIRLLNHLYGEAHFFNAIPNAAERLLDRFKALAAETLTFCYPDQLSSLDFKDKELQEIFFQMCKGAQGDYPSLLHYITFDKKNSQSSQCKINFMYAPKELIVALFPDSTTHEALLTLREAYWEKIYVQESIRHTLSKEEAFNRTEFKKILSNDVKNVLSGHENGDSVFEYSLGNPGNILLVKDALTGISIRQKV